MRAPEDFAPTATLLEAKALTDLEYLLQRRSALSPAGRTLPVEKHATVPSPVVLEFGDAISGISRVPGQAARSIG